MHLIYLCNEYPPYSHGGIGVKYQRIARELAQQGWHVGVVGVYPIASRIAEDDTGVKVYRLPGVYKHGPAALINAHRINRCLRQIHQESPIDIIESQEAGLAFRPRLIHVKKVIRMSGGHTFFSVELGKKPRFWRHLLDKISFSKADAFCAVSHYVAETTRILLNMGETEITILPNPVDTTQFKPQPEIAEEDGAILFVGTITEKKGVRQLIQAMPIIKSAVPNVNLFVVGRDTVDPHTGRSYTASLKSLLSEANKKDVQFVGPVPNHEVKTWIARSQVCVYPSHMEAQGIVVIEGMASGKAVVASKLGPGPELIEDNVHGLLCDPYDPNDIAEKVINLLKNKYLREKLGQAARNRAMKEFSIYNLIQKNISFYESILQRDG